MKDNVSISVRSLHRFMIDDNDSAKIVWIMIKVNKNKSSLFLLQIDALNILSVISY